MSEITIKYRLTIDDFLKNSNISSIRSFSFISIIFCGYAVYNIVRSISLGESPLLMVILLLFFLGSMFLRPVILKNNAKKAFSKNFAFKTDIVVDFFNDHIVEKNEGGETKIQFENHFPLEAIKKVEETQEHYIFFVTRSEILVIPKRALNEEQTEKISNLIQNVFLNRYQRKY